MLDASRMPTVTGIGMLRSRSSQLSPLSSARFNLRFGRQFSTLNTEWELLVFKYVEVTTRIREDDLVAKIADSRRHKLASCHRVDYAALLLWLFSCTDCFSCFKPPRNVKVLYMLYIT